LAENIPARGYRPGRTRFNPESGRRSLAAYGAEAVGIVQSPVATCRLQGVDPRACLEDVLQRVSVHPSSRVQEPAPKRWKDLFAGDPMKSDLGTGVQRRASDPPNGT
ncbi:MAG: transposase domain-containing protein, partial [Albidovulum sp.]|nr:transposase domain-containing protein [Albidovulum sp.]